MKPLAVLAVFLAFASITRTASADACQPPAPGTWYDARVDALTQRGKEKLRAARGFDGEARREAAKQAEALYRDVDTLVPCLPTVVVAMAQALEMQGRYREAAEQYGHVLDARAALEQLDFPPWNEALATAASGRSEALAKIGTVVVRLVKSDCGKARPRAWLDERDVALDRPVPVDPGQHTVRLDVDGCRPFSEKRNVAAGQSEFIDVTLRGESRGCTWDRCIGLPTWMLVAGGAVVAAVGTASVVLLTRDDAEPAPATAECTSATGATLCANLR
jgi:hypothetical protein